jgi:hypothetical protein
MMMIKMMELRCKYMGPPCRVEHGIMWICLGPQEFVGYFQRTLL